MVAYSFKREFIDPMRAGRKTQTIRGPRRHHAAPGAQLQLYTAMRTKYCRLIGTAECVATRRLRLDLRASKVWIDQEGSLSSPPDLDSFAFSDGFDDWDGLRRFWAQQHDAVDVFEGILIRWGGTFQAPRMPDSGR